ncbi:DNA polymerase III subunit delta [Bacteroidia bacterium]|nr:DNA polymerase III subunit delta [Bacteroidia bacterium]
MLFAQIIGHEVLKQKLIHAAEQGRISHAQLFVGNEGRGTLALATAYAQYLNCANPTPTDSCGVCPSCRKYQLLQHPDLHFSLPVASTKTNPISEWFIKDWQEFFVNNYYPSLAEWYNKIDIDNKQGIINVAEAESVINTLNYKAYEGKYKVLIMWYAEQMNVQAANKLLKLIEEPPAQTLLLLVAQNTDTMLKTILSRTQQIVVPPIASEAIAAHLSASKGIPYETALTYAQLSNGDYIEAQNMAVQSDDEETFFNKFVQLMRLCSGNSSSNVIALLMWAEDTCKKFGREEQKRFLAYALHLIRESFAINQMADEAVFLAAKTKEWCVKFAPFVNSNNVEALYAELNLAYGQVAANGNARIIFTDMALKLMKHIHRAL